MDRRDRLWIIREWKAYFNWVLQGCTYPNALGFKSTTVECALMLGEAGGGGLSQAKIPTRYNLDPNVEKLNKTFSGLVTKDQEIIALSSGADMKAHRIGIIVGVTKHNVCLSLWGTYKKSFDYLTNKNESH